jgi:CRISPR-associated endonuclease/helicase Cas3
MNVMLISQCTKNALTETRRILDQFAERRGDRSWQTPITQQGLQTLHRLLRRTARKNTAVACHWIRGKDHSELLWIVGDHRRFNAQGATPTNTTERDVLRRDDENDWHHAEDIRLLATLAALLHDLGKANQAFQKKLTSNKPVADPFRHEWVSLRLLAAFVGQDDDSQWLQRLADLPEAPTMEWQSRLVGARDGMDPKAPAPLKALPPLAQVVGWLILTHHRMPTSPGRDDKLSKTIDLKQAENLIQADWCGSKATKEKFTQREITTCWTWSNGRLPFASKHWREHVRRVARDILRRPQLLTTAWLDNPYVLHLSRLVLMLADHYYSGEPSHARYGDPGFPLHANTEKGQLKQRLDEHLIGVAVNASRLVRSLPRLERQLARIARHKGFRQRTADARFRWQDCAFDLATSLQPRAATQGFFGVNMASTGCGKTLANGRILYGLSHPQQGARFCIALGLRTLTLQTGDAYRAHLGLGAEDMAVLVGGGAIRELHEHHRVHGSESSADLLGEQESVHFEGSLEDGPLNRWLKESPDAQRLLNAPILICTIDHLMPATEGTRGGRQIAPMLRLMSGDLVLDEPDDFAIEDLPALTRLVHWAGMLGNRLLLSSATLPPALIQGLFQTYREGRRIYRQNRGEPGLAAPVCCAWFDEFRVEARDCDCDEEFSTGHHAFVQQRLDKLAQAKRRRQAVIQPLAIPLGQTREAICQSLAGCLREQLTALHDLHGRPDPATGRRVSLGLIRMANIDPLVLTGQALYALGAPEGQHIHLCIYHSQHTLLVRSGIERRLDRLLNRKVEDAIFQDPEMRAWLQAHPEPDQIFVVLATAVAEVGRDHDYDWAIVEPSSMRSIIQLAGRVRRHRPGPCSAPNLYLLDTNVRHLENGLREPAFCRPGFENAQFRLDRHRLADLLTPDQLDAIDSSPRIRERTPLRPRENLVDLEHARLRDLMLGEPTDGVQQEYPIHLWWNTRVALTGELQRKRPFRADP